MTLDTIGQFLQQWWALLAFCGGCAWALIKMFFQQIWMRKEMKEMRAQLTEHDANDKLMETNIRALIDRNKELTQQANNELNVKLSNIQTTVTELNTYMKLLLGDKIKLG